MAQRSCQIPGVVGKATRPSSAARALGLAGALASHPTTPLDAGAALPDPAFVMLSSCVAMTYRYSLALATKYSAALAEPLLRELVESASLLSDTDFSARFTAAHPHTHAIRATRITPAIVG